MRLRTYPARAPSHPYASACQETPKRATCCSPSLPPLLVPPLAAWQSAPRLTRLASRPHETRRTCFLALVLAMGDLPRHEMVCVEQQGAAGTRRGVEGGHARRKGVGPR